MSKWAIVVVTGFHRKHALRLLHWDSEGTAVRRRDLRIYQDAERSARILLWKATDRHLKALLMTSIESLERQAISSGARDARKLLSMCVATIDRAPMRSRQSGRPSSGRSSKCSATPHRYSYFSGSGRSGARFRRGRSWMRKPVLGAGQSRPDALSRTSQAG